MIDTVRLSAVIAERLKRAYRLKPIAVKCTYPVFCGEDEDGGKVFVKLGERMEWERTKKLIEEAGESDLFAASKLNEAVEFDGSTVFVSEWRDARTVYPEDMTDEQIEGFVKGCVSLSAALRTVKCRRSAAESGCDPESLYAVMQEYAGRHPFAVRAIRELMEIPEAKRTYRGRRLTVIHGDFHSKNFGFEGAKMSAVFDFDKVTEGLECSDFVNALAERFSLLSMDGRTRRRLVSAAGKALSASPWAKDEVEIAINTVRLSFAVRRVRRHPRSSWVALDVRRRDNRIKGLLECLKR